MEKISLNIGYIMQAEAVDMSQPSGPQSHVRSVVQGFQNSGHHVRMVAIQDKQILWTDDLFSWQPSTFKFSMTRPFRLFERFIRGIQYRLKLPFLRLFDSLRFADACITALEGYDVLYERFGTLSYGGLIAAKRMGVPCIIEINGDLIEEYTYFGIQLSRMQSAAINFITPLILKNADHVISVGETIKERIIRRWHINSNHITVVTNGVDVELFTSSIIKSDGVRSRYSIGESPFIVFVGSFQPWHGIDLILNAFSQLRLSNSNLLYPKMVLIGDGPLRSEMEAKAESLHLGDQVVFTGTVDHKEVASILKEADITVIYHQKSAAEIVETPLKLFEYMAAGKAIVAPQVPNMERLLEDHVTALLVPPDNSTELARALAELLSNDKLRSCMGNNAKQQAIEKHSWNRVVLELEKIIYDLLRLRYQYG